ncbi:MAG: hypothetical protein HEQ19_09705 [Gloeotrichia echinulata CP02]|jgi:hypothetical protein|nr:hypothetical protein [Gloeotrichia echinulata DEX184]
MKALFKLIVVGLLTTAAGLVGNNLSAIGKEIKTGNFLLAQTPVKTQTVPVALPELADIFLKGGESSSGRVIGIDVKGQKLSIQRQGSSTTYIIRLSKIEKVVFRNVAKAYRTDGRQIIRGDRQRLTVKPDNWNGIPLDTFNIINPQQGQAQVKLGPPVVTSAKLSGILSVAKDRQYVVEQIQFNPQKKTMTIQATPY